MKGCQHRYAIEWSKCKGMSPWKDEELWEDKRNRKQRAAIWLYRALPQGLSIRLFGIIQAYGRPLGNKISKG